MALTLTPSDERLLSSSCRRCNRSPFAHTLDSYGNSRCADNALSPLLPRSVKLAKRAATEFVTRDNPAAHAQPSLPFPA